MSGVFFLVLQHKDIDSSQSVETLKSQGYFIMKLLKMVE